jgi:hypothetical protein
MDLPASGMGGVSESLPISYCQQGHRSLMTDHGFTRSAAHALEFLAFEFVQRA